MVTSDWSQPTDYERWYASSLGRAYGASLQCVLDPWVSEFRGSLIVDIGCGPGLMERLFPTDAKVVGMDCSPEMAHRADRLWRQAGVPRQFVVGSVEEMPFKNESFDVAFCINCLEFVEDRQAAFAEIARILRPQGTAIIGVLHRRSLWELTRRLWRPFTHRTYYQGRFFVSRELRLYCMQAGLEVEELRTAVHFPPAPPGPLLGVYQRYDQWRAQYGHSGGGVLLCRAMKRTQPLSAAPEN